MNIHEQIAHAEAQLKQAREHKDAQMIRLVLRKLYYRLQQEGNRDVQS